MKNNSELIAQQAISALRHCVYVIIQYFSNQLLFIPEHYTVSL